MSFQTAVTISHKFFCLRDAVVSGTTTKEFDAAWSKLSASERKELEGLAEGRGRGKVMFNARDFSPLHQATVEGNLAAVKFLLVSVPQINTALNFGICKYCSNPKCCS